MFRNECEICHATSNEVGQIARFGTGKRTSVWVCKFCRVHLAKHNGLKEMGDMYRYVPSKKIVEKTIKGNKTMICYKDGFDEIHYGFIKRKLKGGFEVV